MIDKKTSLLVNRQVPEFVREEHPKFISFLEAYYEFLDIYGYGKAKELKNISDVDESLDDFEQQFFNSFMPFIPRETALNKETVIKNIMPLYLAKGSEKGYKLLFRMLFGEEVEVEYPGKQILRASDGRWSYEGVLTTEPEIYSTYISDGEKTTYYLPYVLDIGDFTIYVNGSLITSGYRILKEYKKIIFDTAPALNSEIKIYYTDFDLNKLNNRKIVGKTSGASALIERTGKRNIFGVNLFQFFINQNNLVGNFGNGEIVETDLVADDGSLIKFSFLTFCEVESIQIVDGGSNYNVGDPVIIRGPSTKDAIAIVDDIASGVIENLTVNTFGAGYQPGNEIKALEYSEEYFLGNALTIDDSGFLSSNTISVNNDVIDPLANVILSNSSYGFAGFGNANIASIINDALSSNTLTGLGGITSANVIKSLISSNTNPTIIALSPLVFGNTRLGELGVIGQVDILNGGYAYQIGDPIEFNNVEYFGGQGATGVVTDVDANGSITQISIINGGLSYDKNYFPEVNVVSATGANASLSVTYLMGDGATFSPVIVNEGVQGQILSIRVLESGSGYTSVPGIDLTRSGDGNATAQATIRSSFRDLSGKWKTLDGLLSNDQIRLQGRDYYIDYSYVLSSKVEFERYKDILKKLIHPAGLINYAKYQIIENIDGNILNDISSYVSFNETFIGSDTTLITVDTTVYTTDYS